MLWLLEFIEEGMFHFIWVFSSTCVSHTLILIAVRWKSNAQHWAGNFHLLWCIKIALFVDYWPIGNTKWNITVLIYEKITLFILFKISRNSFNCLMCDITQHETRVTKYITLCLKDLPNDVQNHCLLIKLWKRFWFIPVQNSSIAN